MSEFRTSLLREKFTITEKNPTNDVEVKPAIALSNRVVVPLLSNDALDNETFIVRTQNMHTCARFAGAVMKEFFEHGTIANRATPLSWENMWLDVIKGYESDWNQNIWAAVYHKGRLIYHYGEHHAFLDIIEQCDSTNQQPYAESIFFAEQAFAKAGKEVSIDHDSNVALVASCKDTTAKAGVIIRSATGTTTFNYTTVSYEGNDSPIHAHTTLTVAASFLEGVQLAFQVGFLNRKKQFKLIEKFSDEYKQHDKAKKRLASLNRAISNYEKHFHVNYRPERPTFTKMVGEAEEYSIKILQPEIEAKIADGELNANDWIL